MAEKVREARSTRDNLMVLKEKVRILDEKLENEQKRHKEEHALILSNVSYCKSFKGHSGAVFLFFLEKLSLKWNIILMNTTPYSSARTAHKMNNFIFIKFLMKDSEKVFKKQLYIRITKFGQQILVISRDLNIRFRYAKKK